VKETCKAIIIKRISYSDTSVIISCFTKSSGLKSFIYKGGKKKNAATLLPLRIVEINYYQHNEDALASINSINSTAALSNLYQHPVKTSILFFMNEFLGQLLGKIQYAEPHLFEEIEQELIWLNESEEITNYPVFWMIRWIEKLGLKPSTSSGKFFDIESARFSDHKPDGVLYHFGDEMETLSFLFRQDRLTILSYPLKKNDRKKLLNVLMDYCRFHIPEFKTFKSVEILQTVFE